MGKTNDEAFREWSKPYVPYANDPIPWTTVRAAWDARGEHDAGLLDAYRKFTEATDAIRSRRGTHETLREQSAARHRIEKLGGAKIKELEADDE